MSDLFPMTMKVARMSGVEVVKRLDQMVRAMVVTQSRLIKEADQRLDTSIWASLYSDISGGMPEHVALIMEERLRRAGVAMREGLLEDDDESRRLLSDMDILLGFFYENLYVKLEDEHFNRIDEALRNARSDRKSRMLAI